MAIESSSTSPRSGHARGPTNRSSSQTAFPRCTQCNARPKENARNLVVCIDGTSNQFGRNNTNVAKMFTQIDLETTQPEQYVYYLSGIGTGPEPPHILSRIGKVVFDTYDMAVAWSIKKNVKRAYRWLVQTYQEGDQIYLFGFSRGAYQVWLLAGMIHEVGLIKMPTTEKQIGAAYNHYEAIRPGKSKTREIAREFKNTSSWKGLRVHFVGVWDTVSSVGLIRGDVFSASAAHACHLRHALALDELRVKFMPEYFREVNSQAGNGKSKYIVTSPSIGGVASSANERHMSTVSDNGTYLSEGKEQLASRTKEVWFAGSHGDVGGMNRSGTPHHAGNASLLWMRREAVANGLVLKPTDIVWVPDDLDFGTSKSMTRIWRAIEYVPIKHQVSFSEASEDSLRMHKLQPRRIMPGQKVHASVLYANAYKPKATLGEGFDIPIVQPGLEDEELDSQFWETGLFDDTAAHELLTHLHSRRGTAPEYLDRLLFMLRFEEGRQCVRNVPDWQNQFLNLIHNRNCAPLVRLVTIVAYYGTSFDPKAHPKYRALPSIELGKDVFDNAKECLKAILTAHGHRDGPRVVALLRPLTKHKILRENILTSDFLETLVDSLDVIIRQPKGNFGQVMGGLGCLLQCEDTRQAIVQKLGANLPSSNVSRLSGILEINNLHLLTAALRMVLTLARIPEAAAREVCSVVKPRLRELASKSKRLVGHLAAGILLALYDPNDQQQLDIRDVHARANLASALAHFRHGSADGQGHAGDPGQQVLCQLFGLDASELGEQQIKFIGELKKAAQGGNARERVAATMTLVKLCETTIIRTHLCEINMLGVFISQLRRKDSALLAAYALATCLKYTDMKESIRDDKELLKNIVCMLRLNYFDDAVGQVQGFQIFGDFMQHADLRKKIKDYSITELLSSKLTKGKPKEIRTSLICLDIFRSFDEDGPWNYELVARSLEHLQSPVWKVQKAGVTILYALAQTEHGVAAIMPRIHRIVEMLLPKGYLLIQPTEVQVTSASPTSRSEGQTQPMEMSAQSTDAQSPTSDALPTSPSWMLGPACALRILARNKTLRDHTRKTMQYGCLKHLFLCGTLVDEADTPAWRIHTPNRTDVIIMLDKMIKAVDEELLEEGLMSIGDAVLPHIQHWNRLVTLLRSQAVAAISIFPALLGVSVLAILAVIVAAPIYLSSRVYEFFGQALARYQDTHILDKLHGGVVQAALQQTTSPGSYEGEGALGGHHGNHPSGHAGESSRGVEATQT